MERRIHEDCGVAMIRLLKSQDYFKNKYGSWKYALNKMYLMMEKQHNRGQEGAGIASVKLNTQPGNEFIFRERAEGKNAVTKIFTNIKTKFKDYTTGQLNDINFIQKTLPFAGELYMGHLRYSTTGKSGLSYIHPFIRRNNWKAKNLSLCGNFNMTNIDEIFNILVEQGQSPVKYSDTHLLLEFMGHRLDREVECNFVEAKKRNLQKQDITKYIEKNVKIENVLETTMRYFDGGYVICGLTGSGEWFAMRDPWGIRTAFYYKSEELIALTSERPVLQTTFDLKCEDIQELQPGEAIIVTQKGECRLKQILPKIKNAACSFERIYFSRGSDRDIYRERKALGEQLTDKVLDAINYDLNNTVLSFIPNTAEVAFYGLVQGMNSWLNLFKAKQIKALETKESVNHLLEIINQSVRVEKIAWKDIKLRTFITESNMRNDLASHIYDVSYNSISSYKDNLVIIDDSIVRGTTLKESILRILNKLHPKKIIIVSSAPQVRYPDYYGIDMPKLEEFCAFRATIELIKENNMDSLLTEVYHKCKKELNLFKHKKISNVVCDIYKPFTIEEINDKIAEILRPDDMTVPIKIIFQSIEGLHNAIPNNTGDWYFTGKYPTEGGIKLVNKAFIDYYEKVYTKNCKC